ncbi:hypothetical protein ABZ136_36935, partial [Streptomyces microflavus]
AFQNLGYTGEWFVFAGFVLFMWFRLVPWPTLRTARRAGCCAATPTARSPRPGPRWISRQPSSRRSRGARPGSRRWPVLWSVSWTRRRPARSSSTTGAPPCPRRTPNGSRNSWPPSTRRTGRPRVPACWSDGCAGGIRCGRGRAAPDPGRLSAGAPSTPYRGR